MKNLKKPINLNEIRKDNDDDDNDDYGGGLNQRFNELRYGGVRSDLNQRFNQLRYGRVRTATYT